MFDIKEYNPLSLAFLGDAVHSLYARSKIVKGHLCPCKQLHQTVSGIVRASSQAKMLDGLMSLFTEEELRIAKTARNAKTNNVPKHSNLEEYKKSTSFEAILGYNYLINNFERIKFLLEEGEKCK